HTVLKFHPSSSPVLSCHCLDLASGLMTSTEGSWTWLLTQIGVDGPEDWGPGKKKEGKEMTNEKEGLLTRLASCSQAEPHPERN
ncbi:hypothetical protein P7K49_017682, partial [Saguinus oedipus]